MRAGRLRIFDYIEKSLHINQQLLYVFLLVSGFLFLFLLDLLLLNFFVSILCRQNGVWFFDIFTLIARNTFKVKAYHERSQRMHTKIQKKCCRMPYPMICTNDCVDREMSVLKIIFFFFIYPWVRLSVCCYDTIKGEPRIYLHISNEKKKQNLCVKVWSFTIKHEAGLLAYVQCAPGSLKRVWCDVRHVWHVAPSY